jgi:ribosomal protein S12 methylthiotransferase accessory factor
MRPFLADFGITRLARQTGLDAIGIPCFAAIRPNSRTLSVNMGKGVDDDAAMASAIMEAVEYAIAEAPNAPPIHGTADELRAAGRALFDVNQWLPQDQPLAADLPLAWFAGTDLFDRAPVYAPRDALALGGAETLAAISQSTNGLASGNTIEEATFHALCELIERDATTLWIFKSDEAAAATEINPTSFADPVIDDLGARIERAGLNLTLFDQTTDIGVPVIFALLAPRDVPATRYFDLAAGCGCHPVAARAAIRAITEAAQTRVSNIAGARDDFDPAEYHQRVSASLRALAELRADKPRSPPTGLPMGTSLEALFDHVRAQLVGAGLTSIAGFPLGGAEHGVAVVRVLAHGLEDRATNRHWRPGPRATGAMLGLW